MKTVVLISGKAGHGKDTFGNFLRKQLADRGFSVQMIAFADELKREARLMGWDGQKDEKGRSLLQALGHGRRMEDVLYWIKAAEKTFLDMDFIIVTDVRYHNEITFFQNQPDKYRVFTVRVNRFENGIPYDNKNLTPEQKNHPTEVALDQFNFDIKVAYNEGLDQVGKLSSCVAEFLKGVVNHRGENIKG